MDARALVVDDGDRVTATGCLVRGDRGDWFQPGGPFSGFGECRLWPLWRGAVRVTGADFAAVARRVEASGQVQGWATLTGIWSGGQLHVEQQAATAPGSPRHHPRWEMPPCPAPPGGWPVVARQGDLDLDYDLGDLADSGAAVAVTMFRPAPGQPVLVVAAADPAAVEARLRPQLGRSLCVVPSRWTKDQLDSVRRHLRDRVDRWHLQQLGTAHGEDGQAYVAAILARVTPEISAWTHTLPPGIVEFTPWLTPAASHPAAAPATAGE